MKLYAIGVTLYATAYVKADTPDEALAKVKSDLRDRALDLNGTHVCGDTFDALEPDVSLSPAMTVGDPEHDPEEVHDYDLTP